MTETASEVTTTEETPLAHDEKVFRDLHQQGLHLFAQLGEIVFIDRNNAKKRLKLQRELTKIDKKIGGMMAHRKAIEEAKKTATPDLKVVSNDSI